MALLKKFVRALLITFVIGAAMSPRTVSAIPTCTGMDKACGDSIFTYAVKNVGPPPTNECCSELMKFGKTCHDQYVQINIKAKTYQGTLQEFLQRSDKLWNKCAAVGEIVGAPSPTEG